MCDVIGNALEVAIMETLETSCFLFADVVDAPDAYNAAPVVATVHFTGPRVGYLQLECDPSILPAIAENMLGDNAAPASLQYDALGELANVVCGCVLPHLVDESGFRIGAPIVGDGGMIAPATRTSAFLAVDGAPFRGYLHWAMRHDG